MTAEIPLALTTPDVAAAVAAVLDRRLGAADVRPVAVALSGGGDSVSLLLAAHRWARARGRPLVALTVDHRLQPQSGVWTQDCARMAAGLGVGFRALAWTSEKPARGLPAAARAARHRLLADAARACGASVVLIGHTADDVAEARAMRQAGSTTPEPREWSPSPAWPEGRGVFLLRPLLGLRRAALRDWLAGQGARWIEDPANADLAYARARARARAALAPTGQIILAEAAASALARASHLEPWGGVAITREIVQAAAPSDVQRWLGLACVCVGGGARLPPGAARDRLAARLIGRAELVASLAGARVEADQDAIRIVREAGEARRGGLRPLTLAPGEPVVWDGRFEINARAEGLQVRALGGLAGRLRPEQRRRLAALPAAARPSLPAIVGADGGVTSPLLGASPAEAVSLTAGRLRAAAGLVEREPRP